MTLDVRARRRRPCLCPSAARNSPRPGRVWQTRARLLAWSLSQPQRPGSQKPVVVLALDLTWPEAMELPAQRTEPWTVATRWQQTVEEKIQGFGGVIVRAAVYELLASVYGWFTEGFDTAALQEAKRLLAELSCT